MRQRSNLFVLCICAINPADASAIPGKRLLPFNHRQHPQSATTSSPSAIVPIANRQSPIGQLVRTHPPLAPLPDPPPFPLRMEHRLNGEIWAFCKTPEQYPPLSDQEPQQITKTSSTVITRIRARSPHESSTNSNQLSNAPAANSSAPLPQRITSHLGKVGQHRNWWIAYFHPRRMIEWIIGFNENA